MRGSALHCKGSSKLASGMWMCVGVCVCVCVLVYDLHTRLDLGAPL